MTTPLHIGPATSCRTLMALHPDAVRDRPVPFAPAPAVSRRRASIRAMALAALTVVLPSATALLLHRA